MQRKFENEQEEKFESLKEELEQQYERQRKAFEDAEKAKTDLLIEKYRSE